MKIYNTLTRSKQDFKPIFEGQVLMYHCGPTVYWTQHIGNMRAMVWADLIRRIFKYLNYDIKLTRNYTDVGHLTSDNDQGEDKMEKAAAEEQKTPLQIAAKYIAEFERDSQALNILEPDFKPRATECMTDSIKMVQTLLDKGVAYTTDLAIYFDVSQAKNYNRLSGQNLEANISGAGKAEVGDPQKKNPADFALWFFKAGKHTQALQTWKSPFSSPLVANGEGFPGWHLECSVMAQKYLGLTIDIHMGGVEHIPIHHTNEIAQSEAATGQPFVHYWIHNEHLLVDDAKMSKSTGTSYTLQDVINKDFDPLALRYFFLQAHYRSKQNFTWEALEAAQTALEKIRTFLNQTDKKPISASRGKQEYKKKFIAFISDDFNVPQALTLIWEIMKADLNFTDKKDLILDFDSVLGLKLNEVKAEKVEMSSEVQKLLDQRKQARQDKDFARADELRAKIKNKGFEVEDTPEGQKIKKNK